MSNNKIYFICEKSGEIESEFKNFLFNIFNSSINPLRAYLVQVHYNIESEDLNVVLAIMMKKGDHNLYIFQEVAKIFKSIFGKHEKLDFIFLNDQQEIELRKVCCPFFVTEGYQIDTPDFYLTSSEGYGLKKSSIACYKRKMLNGKNPDGYLLCDIAPPLIGQVYGKGAENIDQLILVSRHLGYSIFSIKEWPLYVHIATPLVKLSELDYRISENQMRLIAWGEIYKFKEDIDYI